MGKHGKDYESIHDIPGPIDPRDHFDKSLDEQADAHLAAAQFDASWDRHHNGDKNAS